MAMPADSVSLQIDFGEHPLISALDLSSLIFDLNRAYVMGVRLNDPIGSVQSPGFGRNSYRVRKDLQLQITRIRFESPGLLEVATQAGALIGGLGGFYILLQVLEKIADWPHLRAKARLEKKKLQLEIEKLEREKGSGQVMQLLERIEASTEVQSAVRQLQQNPLKPLDIELRLPPS